MDYFTIASLGNATDFGDSTTVLALDYGDGVSNGHGGIDRSVAYATLPAAMGLFAGGGDGSGSFNLQTTIMYVNIATDGEAGFGGPLNVFELAKKFIRAGAAGVHFEDQLASEKKCGHMGGKVLVPTGTMIKNLKAARLAADIADEIGRAHV